jgi:hypothetical protein
MRNWNGNMKQVTPGEMVTWQWQHKSYAAPNCNLGMAK